MKTPEKLISHILKNFQSDLGNEFHSYHNHAQRTYYYAKTLLLMNENKKLAIAAAFHDLDIWVTETMDYLKGSAGLAADYLRQTEDSYLPDELAFIIKNHHKFTPIKGAIEAEAFRKADLIDLTAGQISFNMPKSLIKEAERKYPRMGFTKMILKKSAKFALNNPLRPLPMMKW